MSLSRTNTASNQPGGLATSSGPAVTAPPLLTSPAAAEASTASAGAAGAPPTQVKGYLIAQDHTGATIKIPYYAA